MRSVFAPCEVRSRAGARPGRMVGRPGCRRLTTHASCSPCRKAYRRALGKLDRLDPAPRRVARAKPAKVGVFARAADRARALWAGLRRRRA